MEVNAATKNDPKTKPALISEEEYWMRIILKLAKLLGVRVNEREVRHKLLIHPDFPSLLAFSDTLIGIGIENQGVAFDKHSLQDQNFPLLCLLRDFSDEKVEGDPVIILKIENDQIVYYDPIQGQRVEGVNEFVDRCSGIALLVERANLEESLVYSRKDSIWFYRLPSIGAPLIMALGAGLLYLFQGQYESIILAAFCFMGYTLCLSFYETALRNDDITPVWGKLSGSSVKEIIESPFNYFFRIARLHEVGFLYFFSAILIFSLAAIFRLSISLWLGYIFFTSAIGVLLSFLSIYYQVRSRSNWCVLCSMTFMTIWLLFISSGFFLWGNLVMPTSGLETFGLLVANSLLAVLMVWPLFRRWIETANRERDYAERLNYLHRSSWFYDGLKMNCEREKKPIKTADLVLGNRASRTMARLILNPFSTNSRKLYHYLRRAEEQKRITEYRVELRMVLPEAKSFFGSKLFQRVQARFLMSNQSDEEKLALFDAAFGDKFGNIEHLDTLGSASQQEQQLSKEANAQLKEWVEENELGADSCLIVDGYIIPKIFLLSYLQKIAFQ